MKVVLTPAAGTKFVVMGKAGPVAVEVVSIEMSPWFSMASGNAELCHGEASSDARGRVDSFTLQASGGTGKVTRRDRHETTTSVVPLVDKPKPPSKRPRGSVTGGVSGTTPAPSSATNAATGAKPS